MPSLIPAKLVFMGDSYVGKTSIVLRYKGQGFHAEVGSTMGGNLVHATVPIRDDTVDLQIWDTAGTERFRSLAPMFLRNSEVAILVFDITNRKSFENLELWREELGRSTTSTDPLLAVFGNKIDLHYERQITQHQAKEYAKKIGAYYFETSALSKEGIEQAMHWIAEMTYNRKMIKTAKQLDPGLNLQFTLPDPETEKKKCCDI